MKKKLKRIIFGHEKLVINELAQRLKDIAFMQAKDRIEEAVKKIENTRVDGEDKVSIIWELTFVVNDIIQIIGRKKRGE